MISKFISKLRGTYEEDTASAKPQVNEDTEKTIFDNTFDQITQREELSGDLELVAVITAAIAASLNTSTDGFVVRSIKRAKATNRWQKA